MPEMPGLHSIRIADLPPYDCRIPRSEVEEIASIVNDHLQAIIVRECSVSYLCLHLTPCQPGAEYTIVGGYRRGKTESNDVDIVFTHKEEAKEKGALQQLLASLEKAEFGEVKLPWFHRHWLTRPGQRSHRRPILRVHGLQAGFIHAALSRVLSFLAMRYRRCLILFIRSHMDPLDKAFVVWLSPANQTTRPSAVHRRVDLIAAPFRYYHCAVLGWSGSTSESMNSRLDLSQANANERSSIRTRPAVACRSREGIEV